jgi:putative phosphoesterase
VLSDHAVGVQVLVLSDTHLRPDTLVRLPAEVWSMAAEAEVILHAGDVTDGALLDALAEHAPVHAVLGNNDRGLEARLPEVLELDLGGVSLAMLHDAGPRASRPGRMARRFPGAQVVVFGHSHDPYLEQVDGGPLLVNPGSATQRRRQPVHTVAWLELTGGEVHSAELVEVGPLRRG